MRDNPSIRCDLLHIDGKHSYKHTVLDVVHLLPAASPNAIAVFDDQCDPMDCDGPPERRRGNFVEVVASQPSLATCDLVRAGLMLPIDSVLRRLASICRVQAEHHCLPSRPRATVFDALQSSLAHGSSLKEMEQ